ncbi:MAG: DUF1343 domain-containing protein [Gemmatimonadetes bacterium]|nr:DUF1343 domain-containing protein [Gemmatimonadota bacterium]
MIRTGVDVLLGEDDGALGRELKGRRLGAIVHPASVTADLVHTAQALLDAGFHLRALFGPQHGARGEKQDNMIESDHFTDPATGLPVHSLYGDVRRPTPEMLDGLDVVICDLQDVGVRVYTFIWTMALAMEACGEAGVGFVVLDRPNPVGCLAREGPLLRPGFESFVGLHPLPLRHGLTCGEVSRWLVGERGVECELEVVPCEGLERATIWSKTGISWVMPSPNLPTPDSCAAYPGMVLLEGTNLSEGRGTTRPFELVGAPFIDGPALVARLDRAELQGVRFRPCHFEPTFNKFVGETCGGIQLHVTDLERFRPVRVAVELIAAVKELWPAGFAWREPPYEYEETLMPIDILWGSAGLRTAVDEGSCPDALLSEADDLDRFGREVEPYLLYV